MIKWEEMKVKEVLCIKMMCNGLLVICLSRY